MRTASRPTPLRISWARGNSMPTHWIRATPAREPPIDDSPPMTTMAKAMMLSDGKVLSPTPFSRTT